MTIPEYGEADTDLVPDELNREPGSPVFIPEPTFDFDVPPALPVTDDETGDSISDSIPTVEGIVLNGHSAPAADEEPKRRGRPRSEPVEEREPKTGPPDIHEWMDFFSKVLLRVICDWYIQWAFSGIDEELLSEREIERIQLSDDERKRIARPFAELSYKSKFMRKHGRMIVASGGAFDALVTLGAWTARVNRIARKYKTPNRKQSRSHSGSAGQSEPQPSNGFDGANGGHIPPGLQIFNPGG